MYLFVDWSRITMKIKKSSFFSPAQKKEYIRLYLSNKNISVFSDYKIIRKFFSLPQMAAHRLYNVFFRRNSKNIIYTLYDADSPVLMALLSQENENIRVMGSREGLEFTDLVYDDSDSSDYEKYFDYLFSYLKSMGYKKLIWDFVSENSTSDNYLKEHFEKIQSLDYVMIRIPEKGNYESYYNPLSKHSRQNIRTAYNRAEKNELLIDFRFIKSDDKSFRSTFKESMKVYSKRQKVKYAKSFLDRLQKRYFHYLTDLQSCKCGAMAALYFNGKMVAFMQGYVDEKTKSFQVPRLAIDDDFSFYSPGILMINEAVKYFSSSSEIDVLDLMQGNEQYKLDMGGEIYNVQNYCLDLLKMQ